MNLSLKLKIIEKYGSQFGFARAAGVNEATVSRVLRGHREIPRDEQNRWADLLDCKREDIFLEGVN